ncbi:MAG TPA: hypothetical protein VGD58_21365 [Herpetosiphonaceae bacterium]
MRNMRGALWALGLAGAAYAWRNRDRLSQQFNSMSGNLRGSQRNTDPQQLPDLSRSEQRDFDTYTNPSSTFNERELGGTSL